MALDPNRLPTPNFGDLWIGRIEDFRTPSGDPWTVFPQFDEQGWIRGRPLIPDSSWVAEGLGTVTRHGTWIVASPELLVLIDTSLGNGKDRPHSATIDQLHTDYLDRLAHMGVSTEAVDAVVTTHFHPDHVGWNTMLMDGRWEPTFPNATYYFATTDVEYWHPDSGTSPVGATIMTNVFTDSIAPILDSARAHLWAGSCAVSPEITLEPAPGHTPGNCLVTASSGTGDLAIFTGDIFHSAVQIVNPHWSNRFCEDQSASAQTRRAVLARAAETKATILPAHFGTGSGFTVVPDGDSYTISGWRDFDSSCD
jgi:glyoxylase-like metal-dependent hydrolase (beta-lactamase superfamily II)